MSRERALDTKPRSGINTGLGRTLTALYALFALAATGRSAAQRIADAEKAPLAYSLSALAAVIYLVATGCLAIGDRARPVAIVACSIELVGVLIVGTLSYVVPTTRSAIRRSRRTR
jgi:hypothetical protein